MGGAVAVGAAGLGRARGAGELGDSACLKKRKKKSFKKKKGGGVGMEEEKEKKEFFFAQKD